MKWQETVVSTLIQREVGIVRQAIDSIENIWSQLPPDIQKAFWAEVSQKLEDISTQTDELSHSLAAEHLE